MTNPSRETDSRESGPYPVVITPEAGTQAPLEDSRGAVGDAQSSAPRQLTSPEVFDLLVKALGEFESTDKTPTAAGVAARMRQLNPSFSTANTEFSTFRRIIDAAAAAGLLTISRTPSDFVLHLVRTEEYRGLQLLPDLWRALQDWTEGVQYGFSRATRRTEPFSPTLPAGSVEVPTVDKQMTVQWMRDFAAAQRGDLGDRLAAGLEEQDPVAGFLGVVGGVDTAKRRWSKFSRSRVLDFAVSWAKENDIPRSDIFAAPKATPPAPATPTTEEADARRRVMRILESMPLHELLRLPIPLEYSLSR